MGKLKPKNLAARKKALGMDRLPKKSIEWRSLSAADKDVVAAKVELWLEQKKKKLRYRPPTVQERVAVFLKHCGVKISERTVKDLAGPKKAIVARWRQCRRMFVARRGAKLARQSEENRRRREEAGRMR
jgi:hypothetical protein